MFHDLIFLLLMYLYMINSSITPTIDNNLHATKQVKTNLLNLIWGPRAKLSWIIYPNTNKPQLGSAWVRLLFLPMGKTNARNTMLPNSKIILFCHSWNIVLPQQWFATIKKKKERARESSFLMLKGKKGFKMRNWCCDQR